MATTTNPTSSDRCDGFSNIEEEDEFFDTSLSSGIVFQYEESTEDKQKPSNGSGANKIGGASVAMEATSRLTLSKTGFVQGMIQLA